jgi:predicted nucleotidyltransferase component of viral defense system
MAASVKSRLLARARSQHEDFSYLLTRFVLERLLYRLSVSTYAESFVLKGALLFTLWSDQPHRATKDLDLLGHGAPDAARLESIFREICEVAVGDDGISFVAETVHAAPIREEALYDGIRLTLEARLGTARVPLQVDVGFGDAAVAGPERQELPSLLGLPTPKLRTYSMEFVIAEKLHAMVDLGMGNSRMKDFFDIWYLAHHFEFNGAALTEAIVATFERRRTPVPQALPLALTESFAADALKRTQWTALTNRARTSAEVPGLASSWRLLPPSCSQ